MLQNLVYATSICVSDIGNKIKRKKWVVSIMADFTSRWIACESKARKHACSIFITVFQCLALVSCISFSVSILLLIILPKVSATISSSSLLTIFSLWVINILQVLKNTKAIWNTQDTLYLRNGIVRSCLEYVCLSSEKFPA